MANKTLYGVLSDGTEIYKYALINSNGCMAEVTDYGAILLCLMVKDKDGLLRDVVLGCNSLDGYFDNSSCFGATVGRNANRIKDGHFEIDGVSYQLAKNDGPNNLHSGPDMYFKRKWDVTEATDSAITLSLLSKDMDQGFPGNLNISVTYILTDENELIIHYHGVSDKKTVINMTNHSFFNLDGHDAGTIYNHDICIMGDYFTDTDERLIPTGELIAVKDTPLDFTQPKLIGKDINDDYKALKDGHGYDQNWVIRDYDGTLKKAAVLHSEASGITMEVYTDLPGIQMYTGNFIDVPDGKNGVSYKERTGVALETQYFPDAVNKDGFKKPVFDAESEYDSVTIYKFQ